MVERDKMYALYIHCNSVSRRSRYTHFRFPALYEKCGWHEFRYGLQFFHR